VYKVPTHNISSDPWVLFTGSFHPHSQGKKYIGQTKKTFDHRMKQHKNSATAGEGKKKCHATAVGRAIRKHGWDNMVKEVILECPNEELDANEIRLIAENKALYPDGYNLTTGGAGCVYVQTYEIKLKRSQSLRRREDTTDLPMYAKYRKDRTGGGFIYERPGHKAVSFTSKNHTTITGREKSYVVRIYSIFGRTSRNRI